MPKKNSTLGLWPESNFNRLFKFEVLQFRTPIEVLIKAGWSLDLPQFELERAKQLALSTDWADIPPRGALQTLSA